MLGISAVSFTAAVLLAPAAILAHPVDGRAAGASGPVSCVELPEGSGADASVGSLRREIFSDDPAAGLSSRQAAARLAAWRGNLSGNPSIQDMASGALLALRAQGNDRIGGLLLCTGGPEGRFIGARDVEGPTSRGGRSRGDFRFSVGRNRYGEGVPRLQAVEREPEGWRDRALDAGASAEGASRTAGDLVARRPRPQPQPAEPDPVVVPPIRKPPVRPEPPAPAPEPSGQQRAPELGSPKGQRRLLATSYCPCDTKMQGGTKTALGTRVRTLQEFTSGRSDHVSLAVDPRVIPLGTRLRIPELERRYNGGRPIVFVAEDTGGAIKGSRMDVAMAPNRAGTWPSVQIKENFTVLTYGR